MTAAVRSGPASTWCRAAALIATVAALIANWSTPAAAHDGVTLTVHGDGRGSVWVIATWGDAHPLSEPVGAVLTATSTTGQRLGPAALQHNGTALTYPGALPTGEWTVVAETGTPAIGRCQAVLRVADPASSPLPTQTRCAPSPAGGAVPARPTSIWYWAAGAALLALAGCVVVYARGRPARPPVRRG